MTGKTRWHLHPPVPSYSPFLPLPRSDQLTAHQTMAASARNIACFALLMSISALHVPSHIDQRGTSAGSASASASAPPPLFDDGALKKVAMLALAGMDAVLIAAAVIYSLHTRRAAVGVGGGNWRRVAELPVFVLCLQVGVLQFVLLEPAAAGDAAAARALWIGTSAAARALPFVASATFFLGITLIYAAHAHVGNRGGAGAVAGNGPVPPPAPTTMIKFLANMTLGAASVCLMTIVLALFYINTK